jgi:glycosyltransferase involved in cell wall biosynthesis
MRRYLERLRAMRGKRTRIASPAAIRDDTHRSHGSVQRRPGGHARQLEIAVIAEVSIPQCKLYRVDHKAQALERLGFRVAVVSWWYPEVCIQALQTCDMVIFYRVALNDATAPIFDEAERLGLPTVFEADDLIFDPELFGGHPSLLQRPREEREELVRGTQDYRAALLRCDHAIASTEALAACMRPLVTGRVFTVENGFDFRELELAQSIRSQALPRTQDTLVIGYGSGTRTHDADLGVAAPALAVIMKRFANVELALHGELESPVELAPYESRVTRIPMLSWDDYLRAKATWDINIAPLEPTTFNAVKSTIKFLEAAIVGVPSVCTSTPPYRDVIEHGVNGFLATNQDDWIRSLNTLVLDHDLRRRVGLRALETVVDGYQPDRLANRQLLPLFDLLPPSLGALPRVLVIDDDLDRHPEHPAIALAGDERLDVALFCAATEAVGASGMRRTKAAGVEEFRAFVPEHSVIGQYWNSDVVQHFAQVVAAWQPDLVVLLRPRRLGVSLVETCYSKGVPYLVLLEDEWWLRDPSLDGAGRRFGPTADELRAYVSGSPNPALAWRRYFELRTVLSRAAALVTGEEKLRDAHVAHGVRRTLFRTGSLQDVVDTLLGIGELETASDASTG